MYINTRTELRALLWIHFYIFNNERIKTMYNFILHKKRNIKKNKNWDTSMNLHLIIYTE
jgi:hypothetical protein